MSQILARIAEQQAPVLDAAASRMAEAIAGGYFVHFYGSGHSVIPALDAFPRYGGYVGLNPLTDPRTMWFNVIGPGGAPELLWIERTEGYVRNFLDSFCFSPSDVMLVYSHGGTNAAPVEAALYAKERGMTVIAVTNLANYRVATATHSSRKKLADVADMTLDNGVPLEDALIQLEGMSGRVAGSSTVAAMAITQALVAATAEKLLALGITPHAFVSPTVQNVGPEHNRGVFRAHQRRWAERMRNVR